MSDQPVHDLTMIGECSHRPHFVLTHEARVTRHVGAKMAASFRSIGWAGEAISSGDQGRAVGARGFTAAQPRWQRNWGAKRHIWCEPVRHR